MTDPIIKCTGLVYIYKSPGVEVVALQGLDMIVYAGETVVVIGASGSGKTTLMNVLSAVDKPSAGRAFVADVDVSNLSNAQRDRYRHEVVGYVWQQANLNVLSELTVEENIQLPLMATRASAQDRRDRAADLMTELGLEDRRNHLPGQLSGGEQHLLALAVGMATRPKVLLADEPTAGLDRCSINRVLSRIRDVSRRSGMTIVMVTHDHEIAPFADRILRIRDGRVSTERSTTGDERVVLDRAGRLQLPRHLINEVGLRNLVTVRRDGARIVIEPTDDRR